MNLVADESVDSGIISQLRQMGIDVVSISEISSGIKDSAVLKIAAENQCLLITEDKDFGELAYRLKLVHHGIFLIRLGDTPRKDRIAIVSDAIAKHFDQLLFNFSVISKSGLRIKSPNQI
jgi:predicted nuclease of predicted toxin-antitoxin system